MDKTQQMLELIQDIDVTDCKCPLWSDEKRCNCEDACDCPRLTLPPCIHVREAEERFERRMTEIYGRDWRESDNDPPKAPPRPTLYWFKLLKTYLPDDMAEPGDCTSPVNTMPGPTKVRHLEHRRWFGVDLWHPDDASPVAQAEALNMPVATASSKLGKQLGAPANGGEVFGDPELQTVDDPDEDDDIPNDPDPAMNERLKRIDALLDKAGGRHGRQVDHRGHRKNRP